MNMTNKKLAKWHGGKIADEKIATLEAGTLWF